MSSGSTYGIGMAWNMVNAGSTSSRVGFSQVGPEHAVQAVVVQQVGVAVRRVHRVDPDEPRRQVQRHLLDVLDEDALGPAVAGAARTHHRVVDGARHHAGGRAGDDDRGDRPAGAAWRRRPRSSRRGGRRRWRRRSRARRARPSPSAGCRRWPPRCRGWPSSVMPASSGVAQLARARGRRPGGRRCGGPSSLTSRVGLLQVLGRGQRIGVRLDLPADVDRDDVRALLGHAHRVGAALAPRRAGDERDFALEPVDPWHSFLSGGTSAPARCS